MARMAKRYRPPKVKKKSAAEIALDYVIFMIGSVLIYYLIINTLRFLFAPMRYLMMTSEQIEAERLEEAKAKIAKRTQLRNKWALDERDPLNIYVEHCLNNEEASKEYANVIKWHNEWERGKVIDTQMRWAPEVYEGSGKERRFSPAFVRYLERQVELHRSRGLFRWAGFAYTIGHYYPEVRMGSLDRDLNTLRERTQVRVLTEELAAEINSVGLSKDIAGELAKLDISGKKLHQMVKVLKGLKEQNLSDTVLRFYIHYFEAFNGSEVMRNRDVLHGLDDLLNNGIPEDIVIQYLSGQLSSEDLQAIIAEGKSYMDLMGVQGLLENSDGNVRLHEYLRECAKDRKQGHRSEILNGFGG